MKVSLSIFLLKENYQKSTQLAMTTIHSLLQIQTSFARIIKLKLSTQKQTLSKHNIQNNVPQYQSITELLSGIFGFFYTAFSVCQKYYGIFSKIHLTNKSDFTLKPLWVSLSGIDFPHFDTPPDGDGLLS